MAPDLLQDVREPAHAGVVASATADVTASATAGVRDSAAANVCGSASDRNSASITSTQRPRVGHIAFLNCLPLYYGMVHHRAVLDMSLTRGTPTELNRALIAGELDVAPISSIEYLRHAGDLVLLPDLTVSSDGPVQSIALVSRVPIEQLDGCLVALTSQSATSHVLTRSVLEHRYGVHARFAVRHVTPEAPLADSDAALLIGDAALRVLWRPPAGTHCYDLGAEWHALTSASSGGAMVYAVWAVRREYAKRYPDLVTEVLTAFRRSLAYSLEHVDEIAHDAARWEPFASVSWRSTPASSQGGPGRAPSLASN